MDTYPDMVSFSILKNARQAKDLAYKALEKAKDGELEEARRLLSISDAACSAAQQAETELLTFDMTGREHVREHSRDHLMSSILATELVHEMSRSIIPKTTENPKKTGTPKLDREED